LIETAATHPLVVICKPHLENLGFVQGEVRFLLVRLCVVNGNVSFGVSGSKELAVVRGGHTRHWVPVHRFDRWRAFWSQSTRVKDMHEALGITNDKLVPRCRKGKARDLTLGLAQRVQLAAILDNLRNIVCFEHMNRLVQVEHVHKLVSGYHVLRTGLPFDEVWEH